MASNICKSCMRALRRQTRAFVHSPQPCAPSRATFATTSSHREERAPSTATPAAATSPVSPPRAPIKSRSASVETLLRSIPQIPRRRENTSYGWTELLYKECARQAHYTIPSAEQADVEISKTAGGADIGVGVGDSWWLDPRGAALPPTFATWSHVTMLHMWLLTVRLRAIAPDGTARTSFAQTPAAKHAQQLQNHFFFDAEDRMVATHRITASGARQKHLLELNHQWRGCLLAYDEGLVAGDAVLAAAVWRNVFQASEDAQATTLAMIVAYARRTLAALGGMSDDGLEEGVVSFGDVATEEGLVAGPSRMMDSPAHGEKSWKDAAEGP